MQICDRCKGSGVVIVEEHECPHCEGTGAVCEECEQNETDCECDDQAHKDCVECHGSGKIDEDEDDCPKCQGDGEVEGTDDATVPGC